MRIERGPREGTVGALIANPNIAAQVRKARAAYPRRELDLGGSLDLAARMSLPVPVLGDVAGLVADSHRLYSEPSERTVGNVGMMVAGLLPGIPSLGATRVWRGGKAPKDGYFYSRDPEYAKGFDKGDYRNYQATADSYLDFNNIYTDTQLRPVITALQESGDHVAAKQIADALKDGAVEGSHLYLWLKRLAKDSPESVLSRAGFDAIDTGRDLRMMNLQGVSY